MPNRLILDVARDRNGVKVIEVVSSEVGAYVAERQYVFKGRMRSAEGKTGTARTEGRKTVLHGQTQVEQWIISVDGSELIVNRWSGGTSTTLQQRLLFRRSSTSGITSKPAIEDHFK